MLQEAWTAKARKAAPANGHWGIARAAGQHTFFQQSGLVTLSKFPILGGEFYHFSRAAYPDRIVNKGVLKVTVQLPGRQVLNVWNVHLQEGGWPEIRQSQVRELVARVQAATDGQIADLVGGDFNCTPESPLCRELANSLGPSVQQLGGTAPFVTWDRLSAKPGAGQTIDYIFIRESTTCQTVQAAAHVAFAAAALEQRLSDHLGIEVASIANEAFVCDNEAGNAQAFSMLLQNLAESANRKKVTFITASAASSCYQWIRALEDIGFRYASGFCHAIEDMIDDYDHLLLNNMIIRDPIEADFKEILFSFDNVPFPSYLLYEREFERGKLVNLYADRYREVHESKSGRVFIGEIDGMFMGALNGIIDSAISIN